MRSLREYVTRVKLADTDLPKTAWPGNVSLLKDFWCYHHCPEKSVLSLREQAERITWKHFHLNLIFVGDEMSDTKHQGYADVILHHVRQIYARFGIGIIRLEYYAIPTSKANGRVVIEDDDEAETLTNEWTVSNNGIDIFMVRHSWPRGDQGLVVGGVSAINGSCDKDYAKDLTGCVVANDSGLEVLGRVMSHELGHYLGLTHHPNKEIEDVTKEDQTAENLKNLMFPLQIGGEDLVHEQLQTIKSHCFIFEGD
jgi:hypothetical protein